MSVKILAVATILALAYTVPVLGQGGYGGGYAKEAIVEYAAPPKYEYKYGVHDPHTGDQKEKVEVREGELTKTQYAWSEKDRQVHDARVIHSSIPVKAYGKY